MILGIPAFHDDVVDDGGEAWITNKRQAKGVALLVPVNALAKRHNSVRAKCLDNSSYGLYRDRGWCGRTLGLSVPRDAKCREE